MVYGLSGTRRRKKNISRGLLVNNLSHKWFKTYKTKIPFRLGLFSHQRSLRIAVLNQRKVTYSLINYREHLKRRIILSNIISNISTRFLAVNSSNLDQEITQTLKTIGKIGKYERVFFYKYDARTKTIKNTHEYCAKNALSKLNLQTDFSFHRMSLFRQMLSDRKIIKINSINELPDEASKEKEMLILNGIKSLLLHPLFSKDVLIGFIGVDSFKEERHWNENEMILLKMVGEIFVNTFQRLEYEKIIQINEKRYRSLFESNPQPMWIYDVDTLNFLEVNEAAINHYGYSREEFLSMTIMDIRPGDEQKMFKKNLKSSSDNYERTGVWHHLKKDGTVIDVEIISYLTPPIDGRLTRFVLINDVTEQRKYMKKLQELNKSKDKFFSILAHDLRSPFQGYLGLTNLLANDLENLSIEELSKIGKQLNEGLTSQYHLLLDLLEWARLQSGKIKYTAAELNLYECALDVIYLLKPAANRKLIKISNKIDKTIFVRADENMLKSVLQNLLTNSIKFTFSGGEIVLESYFKKNMAYFSISDNGTGIDANTLSNLFKIDLAHSSPGTENESGTGLGLILCKEMLEMNGGSLTIDSRPDAGTKVTFSLPLSGSPA